MKHYKIKYWDGKIIIVRAKSSLDVVRKYDLASFYHRNTRIARLSGEQEAIAIANERGN